jgi:hypothetical protein
MATSKKPKKTTTKKSAAAGDIGYRHLPFKPKRFRFKREERPKDLKKLPTAFVIIEKAALTLWENRILFLGVAIVYGLLNLILVQGLASSSEISTLKSEIQKGGTKALTSSIGVFTVLVGSSGNDSSSTAGAYQVPLTIVASLAIIWTLRQVKSGHKIRIRDAYYKGMYPLIPFILVLLVLVVQLIPLIIGAGIYSAVVTNGIAIGFIEHLASFMIFLVLGFWSLYMLCGSIFAIYIVTLPDMTPMKALRSAKQLVKFRRLSVFRKLIFLPLVLLVVAAIIMLPIILLTTFLAQWVFFILTMLALLVAHSYIYTVYRELISE